MPDERKSLGLVGVRHKTPLKQAANIGVTGFTSAKSSRGICTDLLVNSSPHNKRLSIQEADKFYWVLRTEKMLWLGRSPTCSVHTSPPRQILTSGLCGKQRAAPTPSQVCAPLPGQELPPTLPRSPVLLPGSTNNPASPPRETQPEPTTENIKHPLRKLYSRWGEDFGAPGTGDKNKLWGTCTLSQTWNGSKALCSESEEKLTCLEMCPYIPAIT